MKEMTNILRNRGGVPAVLVQDDGPAVQVNLALGNRVLSEMPSSARVKSHVTTEGGDRERVAGLMETTPKGLERDCNDVCS